MNLRLKTLKLVLAACLAPMTVGSVNSAELLLAQAASENNAITNPPVSQTKGIRKEFLQGLIDDLKKEESKKKVYDPNIPVLGSGKGLVIAPPQKTAKKPPANAGAEDIQNELSILQNRLAAVKAKILAGQGGADTGKELNEIRKKLKEIQTGKPANKAKAPPVKSVSSKPSGNKSPKIKYYQLKPSKLLTLANSGDPNAQYELSTRYKLGARGFKKDKITGIKWQLQAANNGHVSAQFRSGREFTSGRNIKIDHKKSVYWTKRAAENGHAAAQFFLYEALSKGNGVDKDPKQAKYWANKAYAQSDKLSVSMRREIERKFNKPPKNANSKPVSLLQLAGIDSPAVRFFEMMLADLRSNAQKGDPDAQFELADRYDQGLRGVKKNPEASFKWMLKASQNGHLSAQFRTGSNYSLGKGVVKNHVKSAYWHRKAAEKGYAYSQLALHKKLESGRGVKKDLKEAEIWLNKAIAQGHKSAISHRQIWHSKN